MTYYNEIDAQKAAWLRELMNAGEITTGEVDERSIKDLGATELTGCERLHFFAGIGVWDYALRLAGWPADWPIWTASCPCQPFSSAGRRGGIEDDRHLWPWLMGLIAERHPHVVIGEQVSSPDGLAWFDIVRTDLEAAGYACGSLDTCAAGVGAPHVRQRLYWCALRVDGLADISGAGRQIRACGAGDVGREFAAIERNWNAGRLEHAAPRGRRERGNAQGAGSGRHAHGPGEFVGVGNSESERRRGGADDNNGRRRQCPPRCPGEIDSIWREPDWVLTRPQRVDDPPGLRPVRPGTLAVDDGAAGSVGRGGHNGFPLAEKEEARVMRLHGYGDAIVAAQAAIFVECVMEEILI